MLYFGDRHSDARAGRLDSSARQPLLRDYEDYH